jgi:hypothetical protein
VVALAVVLVLDSVSPTGRTWPTAAHIPAPNGRVATPGWRLESSAGMEIEVPAAWGINDVDTCAPNDHPTVVRGQGLVAGCGSQEKPTKEVAELIGRPRAELTPDLPHRRGTVDGVTVSRAEGMLADGRYAGSVTLPSGAGVSVRTLDPALTSHILDSLHLVTVDHLGCPTALPRGRPPARPAATFTPTAPTEIDLCYYADTASLTSSAVSTGGQAVALAAALNTARPGRNADAPASICADIVPAGQADAVLIFRGPDGPSVVFLAFSGCRLRGFDNGRGYAQVTVALLMQVMRPSRGGFGWTSDLPES